MGTKQADYDTFPFKLFFKILSDDSNLSLLGGTAEENEKTWERIKSEYRQRHPSLKEKQLVTAYKKVLGESIRTNRDITLLNYLMTGPDNIQELYKELKLPWDDSVENRVKYLEKEIDKGKQKLEIFNAQLKQIEDEMEVEQEDGEIDITKINEAIASLTLVGFPINDFDNLTCGQYDAYSKVAQKKAAQHKNGPKR